MEREALETAFAQALDELNAIKKSSTAQGYLTQKLMEKVEGFEQKLNEQSVVKPITNTEPTQAMLTKFMEQIQATIMTQPKSIVRQFRILLFPEENAREYYRLVFGRILFWMMIFLIATYLFVLGKQFIENWTIIKEKQLERAQYENAWKYLYEHETKKGKKEMEEAWQKSK